MEINPEVNLWTCHSYFHTSYKLFSLTILNISWKKPLETSYGLFINCFHKIFWRAYGNKLKTTYGFDISCFHQLYRTQVFF